MITRFGIRFDFSRMKILAYQRIEGSIRKIKQL